MWDSERLRVALALVLVLVAAGTAAAEEPGNETCLACHGSEGLVGADGRPLHVDADGFAGSVHGALACAACHTDAGAIPHEESPARLGPEACATCHGEVVSTYAGSVHGQANANGPNEAATCTSCHGSPHAIRRATDPASLVYPLTLPRTCGVCHGDAELARRHDIPVVDAYQLYMDSIHGRALTKSGLLVAANCSSCHGFHDVRRARDPASRVHRDNVPSTCGTCHAGVAEAYAGSIHGRALAAGDPQAPGCNDCHTAHQIKRVDTAPWKLQIVSECGGCHHQSLRTYRDTFHGQVTALGFTPTARCSDCHGSHGVLPASDPASSIAPANLVATCKQCHPAANQNFVQFAPHADYHDPTRNPGLYYIARLMHVLIIGVFAFFGLHTLLWLVRSLGTHAASAATPLDEDTSEGDQE